MLDVAPPVEKLELEFELEPVQEVALVLLHVSIEVWPLVILVGVAVNVTVTVLAT